MKTGSVAYCIRAVGDTGGDPRGILWNPPDGIQNPPWAFFADFRTQSKVSASPA